MSKIYIVMPAYNEAENILNTVKQWYPIVESLSQNHSAKLVIANDGSQDNTYAILKDLSQSHPLLLPLDKENSGHGATVLFLYRYAIEAGCDYIFQTDSDGQTNPYEFWKMWDNRQKYDFQIGNRKVRQDGMGRIFVTKVLRLVVWLMFCEWVIDANAPFRLMRAEKLQSILDVIPSDFFLCNVAISAIAKKWNYRIGWHDISFKPRQGGINSINMKRIFKIGWKALGDFRYINKTMRKNELFHRCS